MTSHTIKGFSRFTPPRRNPGCGWRDAARRLKHRAVTRRQRRNRREGR